ncbi:probably inactive leucine-rich repeat receptor-like protein kinase At5g48380 [Manihot esculenta]|uniref:Uncharacterized protein n=2 Tax=Manihot esculenta TaxID=3983 RepID=A0ACB7HFX1_MANES|nr:probably inactive leucine-rich repeat receptor-like protein kinase At5g48380 [Manihot esculenta]KAG8650849.1 hypothetical protein MANES_07G074000v8 [Manihot esculenta]
MQMAPKPILVVLLLYIISVGAAMSGNDPRRKLEEEHGMRFDYSFNSGFIIGYIFSLVSVVTIFISYCFPWFDFKKINEKKTPLSKTLLMAKPRRICYQEVNRQSLISDLEKLITRMSFTSLKKATGSFGKHNFIGLGKKGKLYKAKFPYNCLTAVKRIHNSQHLVDQFFSELMILGKFKHMNIVPVLGFCIESHEKLIVYKYMPNGNLYNWLHPMNHASKTLDFHSRINIAIGIARGLAWLHHNNFIIVHSNLCSSCILLDKNLEPKISNLEGSISFSNIDNIRSTEKRLIQSDIYKFGVLILEIILGQDFYMPKETFKERISHSSTSISTLYNAVDKSLISGRGDNAKIFSVLSIACSCIDQVPDQRPTMLQIYKRLLAVKKINNCMEDSKTSIQTDISTTDFIDIDFEITEI